MNSVLIVQRGSAERDGLLQLGVRSTEERAHTESSSVSAGPNNDLFLLFSLFIENNGTLMVNKAQEFHFF